VSAPGTVAWLARHEFRLAWRDWRSMITAGRRRRGRTIVTILAVFALVMHGIAFTMLPRQIGAGAIDKTALLAITGCLVLSFSLLLSQSLESITRAFYARFDLDLILSSPVLARRVFTVRIAIVALSLAAMAALLAAPFVNVLLLRGGWRWLGAYAVVAGMGAAAAACAVALTVALFRAIGPRRTRLVAQIVAAVIGAFFVIVMQAAAIMSYGTLSRFAILESDAVVARAPEADSFIWWPARAVLGDPAAMGAVLAVSLVLLALAIVMFAPRFGEHVVAAAGATNAVARRQRPAAIRPDAPARALRRKEWTLLLRDPWLASQTLMQLLYLLPPALMLWRSFAAGTAGVVLLVPVLVMAAGQLAGGLAWLAISGEDAPDLVATAPVPARQILRAKVKAVMGALGVVFAPFLLALALAAPASAFVAALGIAIAGAAATIIQLWFRAQAKRSHFRRRQTSSRIATFAEAFSSIAWAGTAALAAAGSWLAVVVALIALAILGGVRQISPATA
jgi:ABC-2 type transport system permease protein